jgi:hypothetical protein
MGGSQQIVQHTTNQQDTEYKCAEALQFTGSHEVVHDGEYSKLAQFPEQFPR